MNYECNSLYESEEMLSREQLYTLQTYRTLGKNSLRALWRSELAACWCTVCYQRQAEVYSRPQYGSFPFTLIYKPVSKYTRIYRSTFCEYDVFRIPKVSIFICISLQQNKSKHSKTHSLPKDFFPSYIFLHKLYFYSHI